MGVAYAIERKIVFSNGEDGMDCDDFYMAYNDLVRKMQDTLTIHDYLPSNLGEFEVRFDAIYAMVEYLRKLKDPDATELVLGEMLEEILQNADTGRYDTVVLFLDGCTV